MTERFTSNVSKMGTLLIFVGAAVLSKESLAFSSQSSCIPASSSIQRRGCRSSFGLVSNPTMTKTTTTSSSFSPLFVLNQETSTTSVESTSPEDDVAMRSLEKKMEEFHRRKEKVAAELEKVDEQLSIFQEVKKDYLQGIKLGVEQEKNFSETNLRSAIKAFLWRIIAGSVTFFTSLRFSGDIAMALSIVASDFFSKAVTMFVGERLMNKSKAGRKSGTDNNRRSLAKALIWRVFAICNTLTMSLIVAKDLSIASKIAGSDAIFKTGLMFFYERVWAKVEWGKDYFVDFII